MAERSASRALWIPLTAGLVGAGLALLFAPRSGKETREKIRENLEEFKDSADNKLAAAREKVDERLEEAKALKGRLAGAIKTEKTSRSDTASKAAFDSDEVSLPNWEGEV